MFPIEIPIVSAKYLECFSQEEALLHIVLLGLLLVDIAQAAVAVRCTAMLLQRQYRLPAPVAILLVVREAPKHEVALKCLRPEYIVLLLRAQRTRLCRIAEAKR